MTSKEMLGHLAEMKIPAKSASSTLEDAYVSMVRKKLAPILEARAAEIEADAILLAKNIDGVYSADPHVDARAVKYDNITYDEVLAQHLAVMDTTATSLSMDNAIPVIVFALKDPENIVRAVLGEKIGTVVTK